MAPRRRVRCRIWRGTGNAARGLRGPITRSLRRRSAPTGSTSPRPRKSRARFASTGLNTPASSPPTPSWPMPAAFIRKSSMSISTRGEATPSSLSVGTTASVPGASKNSWGTGWGERGYAWIKYGANSDWARYRVDAGGRRGRSWRLRRAWPDSTLGAVPRTAAFAQNLKCANHGPHPRRRSHELCGKGGNQAGNDRLGYCRDPSGDAKSVHRRLPYRESRRRNRGRHDHRQRGWRATAVGTARSRCGANGRHAWAHTCAGQPNRQVPSSAGMPRRDTNRSRGWRKASA